MHAIWAAYACYLARLCMPVVGVVCRQCSLPDSALPDSALCLTSPADTSLNDSTHAPPPPPPAPLHPLLLHARLLYQYANFVGKAFTAKGPFGATLREAITVTAPAKKEKGKGAAQQEKETPEQKGA